MVILLISITINTILLFCLFSPDVCYLIHRRHFIWPKKVNKSEEIEWLQELPYEQIRIFDPKLTYTPMRTYVRYEYVLALLNKRRNELYTKNK